MTNETRYIVAIRPGSAAEKALRFVLPADKLGQTLLDVIQYGLGLNHPRAGQRIAETIKNEMAKQYGVTVNDAAAKPEAPVKDYFTERTIEGQTYQGADITVASKQTGGLEKCL
ncbi:hypothetical protein HY639_02545 [Candidatus Woesearchaeota archaeon]|nr:hypothetical protein [Candidatus Woesearchaeota archaeon]